MKQPGPGEITSLLPDQLFRRSPLWIAAWRVIPLIFRLFAGVLALAVIVQLVQFRPLELRENLGAGAYQPSALVLRADGPVYAVQNPGLPQPFPRPRRPRPTFSAGRNRRRSTELAAGSRRDAP